MKFKVIVNPKKDPKRFSAVFTDENNNKKVVKFGSQGGKTFIDHGDVLKKKNYIKRHRALNENWKDPFTPGALSRWILWEYKDLQNAIMNYKIMFNLQ